MIYFRELSFFILVLIPRLKSVEVLNIMLLGKHSVLVLLVLKNVRYNYVSKLTISVLEEAFKLQDHLLALRRYHFMELADWADLFILSLWHHVFLNSDSE